MPDYPTHREWLLDTAMMQDVIADAVQWRTLRGLLGLDAAATAEGVATELRNLRAEAARLHVEDNSHD